MSKYNIENLLSIEDFDEARKEFEESILKINSLIGRSNLSTYIARLYKTLAENTRNKEIKKKATIEAEYFLAKAVQYGENYKSQKLMLPEQFNADMPIE